MDDALRFAFFDGPGLDSPRFVPEQISDTHAQRAAEPDAHDITPAQVLKAGASDGGRFHG